jgi:GNAT superfamily N-acetyltransferase
MVPDVQIRRMETRDIDGAVKVYEEVFEQSHVSFSELDDGKADTPDGPFDPAPHVFRSQLKEYLDHSEALLLVACIDREVVGFAVAELRRAQAGHMECWLHDMGVREVWRGRGIGRALAEPLIEWGTGAGAKYFLFESGVGSETARRMCRTMGFAPLATVYWRAAEEG